MIFCPKCGEPIPDDSINCPKCGEAIKSSDSEQAVVYASQKKKEPTVGIEEARPDMKKSYIIWGVLSLLSLTFLKLNYMSISIDLYFGGSSDTDYTGYYLTQCLQGTARLSGIMVIILIIIAISGIVTASLGIKGDVIKNSLLKKIMMIEAFGSGVVTVITFFHVKSLLADFDSSLSTASVGPGCYLNIAVAVVAIIMYFKCFSSLQD